MIVQKINTHVRDALNRLLQQFKGRPRIESFYTALIQQVQDLEDALYDMDAAMQLWNGSSTPAVGAQLDIIGDLVGIKRNGLPDNEYILFIFGKIADNFSDTTIETIITIFGYLFQGEVFLQELFPAGIGLEAFGSPIPPNLYPVAKGIVQQAMGAGIEIRYMAVSSHTNVFRYKGPNTIDAVNGYGTVSDPSQGGVYIGLI